MPLCILFCWNKINWDSPFCNFYHFELIHQQIFNTCQNHLKWFWSQHPHISFVTALCYSQSQLHHIRCSGFLMISPGFIAAPNFRISDAEDTTHCFAIGFQTRSKPMVWFYPSWWNRSRVPDTHGSDFSLPHTLAPESKLEACHSQFCLKSFF